MRINGDLVFHVVDGSANALKNAMLERLAGGALGVSLPANGGGASAAAGAGRIVYNTDESKLYFYNGTTWSPLDAGGTGASQAELDATQAAMGYVNGDGTINASTLNALGNVTGLTGSSTLVSALTQLDAAITAAAGVDTLGELTDVTLTAQATGNVLYADSGSSWINATPDAAGLVAKTGTQTISGAKTFSASTTFTSTINADAGTAALPSIHLEGDTDTGLYQSAANELGVSASGAVRAVFSTAGLNVTGVSSATTAFRSGDGSAGTPAFSFTADTDTGIFATGAANQIAFSVGGVESMRFQSNGLLVANASLNYETLVTAGTDDAIPNRKYVTDAISAASVATLGAIGDVTLTSLAAGDFLIRNAGNTLWINQTAAAQRTSLGLVAGGTGDIWVEKAGDTMTGGLNITSGGVTLSGASVVTNTLGTAALPSYTFSGDLNTGMSAQSADTLVLSAGGVARLTIGTSNITAAEELIVPDASAVGPSVAFASDPDTGMYRFGANSIGFSVGGANAFTIESNGTLNVAGTATYEALVTDDDDIPNKKYVDDAITTANGTISLDDLDNVVDTSAGANEFLVTDGAASWITQDASAQRTSLGLVAGGTGDIWVEKAGDTMSGNLNMGSNSIISLATPTAATDAANKEYVDSVAAGLDPKQSVQVATTTYLDNVGNGTWTKAGSGLGKTMTAGVAGTTTLDGVLLADGDRVLIKNEDGSSTNLTNIDNGIYVVSDAGAGDETVLTRATDFDGTPANEVSGGNFTFVEEGTVNQDSGWVVTGDGDIVVDTGAILFTQFSGAGSITAGVGLSKTGNVLDVNLGAGIFELPTDEVGIELHDAATGAIILTTDGSARSTASASKLHLLLDGTSLTQGASGLAMSAITIDADAGTNETIVGGNTLTLAGGTGITTTGSATDTITFDATVASAQASSSLANAGVASFDSTDFDVDGNGFVTLDPVGVQANVSFTFGPLTGDDIVLTGTDDTLDIKSTTLTVVGDAGDTPNPSITIDLNAILSDLNDVDFSLGGGGELTGASADNFRNRVDQQGGTFVHALIDYTGGPYNPGGRSYGPFSGFIPNGGSAISRGVQMLVWNPDDEGTGYESGRWNAVWSDSAMAASGMQAFWEWQANGTAYDQQYQKFVNGSGFAGWSLSTTTLKDAQDETDYDNSPGTEGVFNGGTGYAVSDTITLSNGSIVTVVAEGSGVVTQFTVAVAAEDDPVTVAVALTQTSTSGTGTGFTLTPDTDNVDNGETADAVFARWDKGSRSWRNFTPAQMVTMLNTTGGLTGVTATFTVAGTSGTPQTITTGVDTLTIAAGTGITTTAGATDTVTVALNASINDLNDVTLSGAINALTAGDVLVYDASNDDFRDVSIHYVESSASATSHVITHGLGQQYVNVTIVDGSDQVIIPQSITMDSSTQLTVTLSSAAAITVIVTGVPGVAVI